MSERISMFRKNYSCTLFLLGAMLAGGVAESRAQLAPRKAEEWEKTLESPNRTATQKVAEVLSDLSLKPGMIVADIGAGSGFFSRPLAKAVAPTGKENAGGIQQGLLGYMHKQGTE